MTARSDLAIALGGGGARGLAHIVVLEALDELGLRPALIAGTSMGALVGAVCAAGLAAGDMREQALEILGSRRGAVQRIIAETGLGALTLFNLNPLKSSLVDGEDMLDVFWPDQVPVRFEDLVVPLRVIATDFYARREMLLDRGNLRTAVAASIALPGLLEPKIINGRFLIDGGIANPLPIDHLGDAAIKIAVDVTGGPVEKGKGPPPLGDLLFRSLQITQAAVVEARLADHSVDVLIRPAVDRFRVLDFFKIKEVFEAAEPAKEELKRALDKLL